MGGTQGVGTSKSSERGYLALFFPERQEAILLGALASVYGREGGGTDTAVWLAGGKEKADQRQPGIGSSSIAHETIEA